MKAQNTLSYSETELPSYTDLAPQSFSAACRSKLEALKNQLVQKFTLEFSDVQARLVRQAVEEAYALATLTIVPQLLLPTLAEEKVQDVRNWTNHQQAIHQHAALAFAA